MTPGQPLVSAWLSAACLTPQVLSGTVCRLKCPDTGHERIAAHMTCRLVTELDQPREPGTVAAWKPNGRLPHAVFARYPLRSPAAIYGHVLNDLSHQNHPAATMMPAKAPSMAARASPAKNQRTMILAISTIKPHPVTIVVPAALPAAVCGTWKVPEPPVARIRDDTPCHHSTPYPDPVMFIRLIQVHCRDRGQLTAHQYRVARLGDRCRYPFPCVHAPVAGARQMLPPGT